MNRPDRPILEARGLVADRGGRRVLDVPSLQIMRGEVLSIIGPNGSGKSTLLLSLALLLHPSQGEILFYGKPIWGSQSGVPRIGPVDYRRHTATVFQEPLLLDTTVERNVATGLRLRGMANREAAERVREWLEKFDIAHLARRSARTLSGGEAQRVSLARAFVLRPEVLFLDEPFAALDAPTKASVLEDVERSISETGVATVFVTHDRNEALALGDRVAVLMKGEIRQIDAAAAVFQSPVNEEIAAFVGVETVMVGVVTGCEEGLARVEVGRYVVEAVGDYSRGQKVLVCLRPEDITLSTAKGERSSSARNHLSGVIAKLSPVGPMFRVVVDCGFTLVAAVTRQSASELGLKPGSPIEASFKASAIHIIRK